MSNLISAKVVLQSKHSFTGKRMITFELEMPRIILAELNTHKILVRNCQSSRAVPIKSAIQQLLDGNHFVPSYWGKKQAGMSASEENNARIQLDEHMSIPRERAWKDAMITMSSFARAFDEAGYHKQIAGRLLEPFMMVRVLLSGTEWDNLYNLRVHPTAEPHFRDLAIKMYQSSLAETLKETDTIELYPGEWHLPYINYDRNRKSEIVYLSKDGKVLTLDEAIHISLSCCAQTSYRKHDDSLEKAESIVSRLFGEDSPVHASPAEHLSSPSFRESAFTMTKSGHEYVTMLMDPMKWEKGITHIDREGKFWSAQFKNWIQYRQLIPNHVCNNFTHEKFLEYTKDKII